MITAFAGSAIWSEDLNNLLPFYRDTLGLKIGNETLGFVVLGEPNTPTLALGTHSEVKGRNADPARHMVMFVTDDVEAEFRRLRSKGVAFIEEPTNYGPVTVAVLTDPEGNYVQLLQFA